MSQPGLPSQRILQYGHMAMKACRHGLFLFNVNDTFIGRSLDLYGEWCEPELMVLNQIARPGSVVLDIGANIGTHTVSLARSVGPEGVVYAFEPQRLQFQNLCANIALNALMNVITRHAGVSDQHQQILLPVFDPRQAANFGAIGIEGYAQGEPVELIRIDDLGLSKCDLMKIDVEGMEPRVLLGARETISRLRPVLFIENDTVERSRPLLEMIFSLDYVGFWQIAPYFNPANYFGNTENVFGRFQPQSNVLCFHKSRKTEISGMEPITGPDDDWIQAVDRFTRRQQLPG